MSNAQIQRVELHDFGGAPGNQGIHSGKYSEEDSVGRACK
jgi:hypothetical protein